MPPPKQKPTTPILPVQSGRAFSQRAAAMKSSVIFGLSTLLEQLPALLHRRPDSRRRWSTRPARTR